MKVGEIVFVRRIAVFEGIVKIAAEVVWVKDDSFWVQATRGTFDEEGHDRLALNVNDKGRTWELAA